MSSGFSTMLLANQAVEPQIIARGLNLRLFILQKLCYLGSKNKGAVQPSHSGAADLGLGFSHLQKQILVAVGPFASCIMFTFPKRYQYTILEITNN